MKTSEQGLKFIADWEGIKLNAYKDGGGVWTIGIGHTKGVHEGMTCSRAMAFAWLAEDVAEAEKAISQLVLVALAQNQFDALVSFIFNLGRGAFFYSTLRKLLNKSDYFGAADQFPRWNKDNGKVVHGLERRRLAERDVFLRGLYASN